MIGIKDFEMPKSCEQCDLCDWHGTCMVLDINVENEDYTDEGRFEDCPLVEIKGVEE